MTKEYNHRREDITVAEGREAFADLLFSFFDRKGWWKLREKPWKRLSREMGMKSPQTVERIIAEGAHPGPSTIERMSEVTGIPIRDLLLALGLRELQADEYQAVNPERVALMQAVSRLPDETVHDLLDAMQRVLEKHAQQDNVRERDPKGVKA